MDTKKIELVPTWIHWSQDISDMRGSARFVVSFLNIPTVLIDDVTVYCDISTTVDGHFHK